MKLRHKVEVHTVQAANQRRRQEDNVDDCENLYNLVLLDVYQTQERILEVVQTVKTETRIIKYIRSARLPHIRQP